jgi:hypothetical protein
LTDQTALAPLLGAIAIKHNTHRIFIKDIQPTAEIDRCLRTLQPAQAAVRQAQNKNWEDL